MNEPVDEGRALVLGFARGVSPSKWARRWSRAAEATGGGLPRLELAPLAVNGRPERGREPDVILERIAPGERPAGTTTGAASGSGGSDGESGGGSGAHEGSRRAVRLYAEAVALVVAADHELVGEPEVDRGTVDLVGLLAHPDHPAAWPDPDPWADPSWAPADAAAALDLVATGTGAILLPLPLARHLAGKRTHAVLHVTGEPALPGTEIWASWAAERDAADVQQLIGILRGRTARSGRSTASAPPAKADPRPAAGGGKGAGVRGSRAKKAGPPKNSRGAQLAAARAKQQKQKQQSKRGKKPRS